MSETAGQTRAEKLAGQIAEAILSGDFPPGHRLDEQMLAQRFDVSRTPVREALRQLAASALIELRPRKGAVVTRITAAQLETMFVAMGEMEATCARLAAISMTPIERRRLQSAHEAMAPMARGGDPGAYAEANIGFHALIYTGSHNPIIADITAGLRRRLMPFRRAQFHAPGRVPHSYDEHAAIVQAILAGDAAAAHARMLHHVSLVEDAFEQFAASSAA